MSGVRLSRTLLHPIMSELADARGKSELTRSPLTATRHGMRGHAKTGLKNMKIRWNEQLM